MECSCVVLYLKVEAMAYVRMAPYIYSGRWVYDENITTYFIVFSISMCVFVFVLGVLSNGGSG